MAEKENLIDEFKQIHGEDAWHGPGLNRILVGITPEMASARPAGFGHTIFELIRHIQAWENVSLRRLQGEHVTEPEEGDFPEPQAVNQKRWQEAISSFDESHERLIEIVSNLDSSDLEKKVIGQNYTVAFMLHGLVRHHVYHSGQISFLKRILSK